MRPTIRTHAALSVLALLAACSTPPEPPTVDESQKRPVNSAMAVELQVCRNDLHNTRLLATESGRLADSTAATLASLAARQQMLAALAATPVPQPSVAPVPPASAPAPAQANSVYSVRFDFGSTRVAIPPDVARSLVEHAKAAPLVLLRGRTDGTSDAPAESRIARERAQAVRDWLAAAGLDPARLRITYQPSGDHVADNDSAGGRQLNRRVEIELYRALPVPIVSIGATAAQP